MNKLISMLKRHEGRRLKPYLCTADKLTIGYGRNLDESNRLKWKKRPEEKRREYWQNYYTEEVKNRKTEKARKRREINPFKPRKLRSERKTRIRLATVKSKIDQIRVQEVYIQAQKLTLETGIEYCVDHIIPIAHPDVCGLHTFANLQIITSEENRKKGQHFDPTEHEFIAEKT
jgi:predicted Fe-S protein YdhL (DUF1289 family)